MQRKPEGTDHVYRATGADRSAADHGRGATSAAGGGPKYRLGAWIVREDWPLWLLFAGAFVVGAVLYPSMPDRVPTHWGVDGQVDGWSGRGFGTFAMPAFNLGVYLLMLLLPLVDPRRDNYARFRPTYRVIRALVAVFFTVVWSVALAAARGVPLRIEVVVPALVSLFIVALGNFMGRLRYNWFFGIRTPWSLSSEEAWRLTHRAAGPAWVIGGLISLAGAFLGGRVAFAAMLVGVGGAAVFSVVYSYVAFRRVSSRA